MSCHSQLSSVVFVDTFDVYSPNQSLVCKFTVNDEALQGFDETSWVGIFKVGWESLGDFVARKFLPTQGETEPGVILFSNSSEEVCFEAEEIPEESDDEFYQFCFISGKGTVLGASCPFQIGHNNKNGGSLSGSLLDLSTTSNQEKSRKESFELEWCPWLDISGEDVDDTVLVHNRTTLLEKSLGKVIEENNNLRETIENKESEIEIFSSQLLELQNQMTTMGDMLNDKRRQQEVDIGQLDDMTQQLSNAKTEEDKLKRQVHEISKVVSNLTNDWRKSKEEIETLVEQLNEARDRETRKCEDYEKMIEKSHAALTEMGHALVAEKKALGVSKSKQQEELTSFTESFNAVLSELAACKDAMEKLQHEKMVLNNQISNESVSLDKQKRDLLDTINEKEKRITELEKNIQYLSKTHQEKVSELQNSLSKSSEAVTVQQDIISQMKEKVGKDKQKNEEEEDILQQEVQQLKQEKKETRKSVDMMNLKLKEMEEDNSLLKEKSDGHNGARHALQVAYMHTQRQLAQLRGERDVIAQQYQSFRQQSMDGEIDDEVRELKKQVEDLKLRLCIGANAYKEKYMECKKMQNDIRRLKKSSSICSQEPDKLERQMSDNFDGSNHLSRARIIHKSKEVYTQNDAVPDVMKTGIEFKKYPDNSAQVNHLKENYDNSVFKLTAEIKGLQNQLRDKDTMLQQARNASEQAEEEANSLKQLLALYQPKSPEGAATRMRAGPSVASQTTGTEPPEPKGATIRCPVGDQSANYKIFHPPSSIMESSLCFSEPYCQTLRPPVSLSAAQIGQERLTPSGYSYCKPEPVAATVVPPMQSIKSLDCPVCGVKFPLNYSELTASNHVNSHFPEVTERVKSKAQRN